MDNSYKRELLGNFIKECDVHDNHGNHCQDEPVHFFEYNGNEVGLCERCYINYKNGALNKSYKIKNIKLSPLYFTDSKY